MTQVTDHTGKRFYQLTVVERAENTTRGRATWLCKCDCGRETNVPGYSLVSGNTKSCGCRKEATKKTLGERRRKAMQIAFPGNTSAILRLYAGYKKGATVRDLVFELDLEDFKKITQQPCYYCGIPPAQVIHTSHSKHISYIHNGIDRLENRVGYVKGNVVACCTTCNYAKGTQSTKEFSDWIKRIHENFIIKSNGGNHGFESN